jgi:L-ascorbate metabolism protein UlaG (beta-lactamase superfamily)
MLPVGDNFTMGYEDAIRASDYVKCNHVIAMHYNTFDLIKIDTAKVAQAFEKAGKRITFMEIGETKEI